MKLRIREDALVSSEVIALLHQHLALMRSISPPESVHALNLDGLRAPGITAWTAWIDGQLAGCGALKALDDTHGEIKSMHTAAALRGQGAGGALLRHILRVATDRGMRRLSLETGSTAVFEPARVLYARFGFSYCGPFADYEEDPHSVFMTLALPPV